MLQSQIGAMENSVSRIQDVACALEDCRWGLPTKSSSKPKASSFKMKMSAGGDVDGEDDEQDEQDEQEGGAGADDATEKRNEAVSFIALKKRTLPLTFSKTAKALEDKVKQIIDQIKIIECRIKAVGEIISVLQQEEQIVRTTVSILKTAVILCSKYLFQKDMAVEMKRRLEKILGNYMNASDRMKCMDTAFRRSICRADSAHRQEQQAVQGVQTGRVGCSP